MASQKRKKTTKPSSVKTVKVNLANIPFGKLIYLPFVLITINLIGVLLIQKFLPPEVPLFYGLPEGQEQLTQSPKLAIPSLVSLTFTTLNLFLAFLIKDNFLKQALIATAFVVTIFSTITTIQIILLVSSF